MSPTTPEPVVAKRVGGFSFGAWGTGRQGRRSSPIAITHAPPRACTQRRASKPPNEDVGTSASPMQAAM